MQIVTLLTGLLLLTPGFSQSPPAADPPAIRTADYRLYNQTIVGAESLLADRQYEAALAVYQRLFAAYDFVFLREYRVATQLALQTGRIDDAFTYLKRGIAGGWTMKSIRANKFLDPLRQHAEWKVVQTQYDSLWKSYQKRLNPAVGAEVKKLFGKDQRKALQALVTIGAKNRARFTETKFAPHSERQLASLNRIIDTYGYPGERLTGNRYWAAVILSHHNSISKQYALADTVYPALRPKLLTNITLGNLSAYEFGMIDNWSRVAKNDEKGYGFLSNTLSEAERVQADQLRSDIGLSSIDVSNRLIMLHRQTGFDPYLPSWSTWRNQPIQITP